MTVSKSTRVTDILSYAHDASHYLLKPQAIYTPDNAGQLAEIFSLATSLGIGVTFRSGGTSLSGQASTDGFLVDTRKNFRAISVGENGERVTVAPGATVRAVNGALARHKRKLGPDPASEIACTIGGVVANNSSGMCCGTEHNTYRTIESLLLVLPSGSVIDTGLADADSHLQKSEPEIYAGLIALRDRVRNNPESVATIKKLFSIKNTMGYGVNSFLDFDSPVKILEHLIVGSEGTLAFVAEARFTTVPAYSHMATGLLVFHTLADATRALPDLVAAGFAAIELMDATSLKVAQRDVEATPELMALKVEKHAALLVEFQEADASLLKVKMDTVAPLLSSLTLAHPPTLSSDPETRNQMWHIRKGLYATVAGNRPAGTTALLEDIAVPVPQLLETCEALAALFAKHGYEDAVIFGHARDGNIHFMLNEEFDNPTKLERYLAFTEEMVSLVLSHNGTLKAEHGTGRIMAPYVERQYGTELYEVMWAVKRLLDPAGILNPGIVLSENPRTHYENLKVVPTIEAVANSCVECGYCEPVCPSKNLTLTPRKRIVMRRELVMAQAAGNTALAREIEKEFRYDGEETCAVDGMCETACPVRINTGSLVRELRAEHAKALPTAAWNFAAKNWALTTTVLGKALTLGSLVPGVKYPRGGKVRKAVQRADATAIFFPSCTGSLFGTSGSSESLMVVAERAGVTLSIPEGISSMCCGTPWKSKGYLDGYSTMREMVIPQMLAATKDGALPIITDAASCSHGLVELLSSDSRFTVMDGVEFLEKFVMPALTMTKKARSIAVHPTCSTTSLGVTQSLKNIAGQIADEVFIPESWGCCGFAGDRGLTHPELTASATAAQAKEIAARVDEFFVSANRTCEIGMTQATGKRYRHIIEVVEELSR